MQVRSSVKKMNLIPLSGGLVTPTKRHCHALCRVMILGTFDGAVYEELHRTRRPDLFELVGTFRFPRASEVMDLLCPDLVVADLMSLMDHQLMDDVAFESFIAKHGGKTLGLDFARGTIHLNLAPPVELAAASSLFCRAVPSRNSVLGLVGPFVGAWAKDLREHRNSPAFDRARRVCEALAAEGGRLI